MHTSAHRRPTSGALIVEPVRADICVQFEYLWHLVLRPGETVDAQWRVVADGYIDIAMRVALSHDVLEAAVRSSESLRAAARLREAVMSAEVVVCGAAGASRLLAMPESLLITGIRVRHGFAAGLLRTSPSTLMDNSTALRVVVGTGEAATSSALRSQNTPTVVQADEGRPADRQQMAEAAIRRLSRARVESIARQLTADAHAASTNTLVNQPLRAAMRMLDRRLRRDEVSSDGLAVRVTATARSLGMSMRTLERLFADQLGMTARTYQRLGRVGVVAQWLERDAAHASAGTRVGNVVTLSALAQNVGYADHAHMTREFVGAMGLPPSSFRREAMETQIQRLFGPVHFERGVPVGTVTRTGTSSG